MIENLQPGTYRVVEVDGDKEHYNLDAPEQTIELARDQAEIPTLIFQNTIKKHFGIYKIDEETRELSRALPLRSGRTAGCWATTPRTSMAASGSRMQSRVLIRQRRS